MKTLKNENFSYLGYLAGSHFIIHVYTTLLPVLLLPFQDELGVSLVQLSLLASIPRILNVLIYIPAGMVADRHPAMVLTASLAVTALGAFIIPLSSGFEMLLIGFTLLSVGSTLYHPPSLRMASEYSTKKVSLSMGIHNMGSSLGFASGPLLLGLLLTGWGWRSSFFIWGVLTVIATGMSWFYTTRTLRLVGASNKKLDVFKGLKLIITRNFLLVVAMSAIIEASMNNIATFAPVYFTKSLGMSYSLTSIVSGLAPLAGIVGSFTGGFAGDRFGKYRMGIICILSMGVMLLIMPATSMFLLVVGLYAVYRFLQAAFMPVMNSMIASQANRENLSLCFSFNFVIVNLFGSLATTGVSMLIESNATSIIFPISIIGFIPCLALVYILWKGYNKIE